MAKYTTETFIERAKSIHGDRFCYNKINYINSYHKITAKCKKHNLEFTVDPISFIRTRLGSNGQRLNSGNFCRECKVNAKLTHEEFMDRIKKYEPYYDLSQVKFEKTRNEVTIICKKHNETINIEARHLSSKGLKLNLCSKCKKENNIGTYTNIKESEDAVFYKIIMEHKETKLKWLKIGITNKTVKGRYLEDLSNFNIEVLEETIASGLEVMEMERKYKEDNKHRRFHVPSYAKFNGFTECYIIDEDIQLKASQVKFVRDALIEKQNNECCLCKQELSIPSLDHFHSKFHNGDGKIRGVLCNTCNRFIGAIENNAVRNNIEFSELPNFLRQMADYASKDHFPIIHPKEVKKEPPVSKRNYNLLKKEYIKSGKKPKFPEYPKSKKLTIKLKELFTEFNIEPYN